MRLIHIIFWSFSLLPILSSQQLSIQDIESGRSTYLKPASLKNLQWTGKEGALIYSDKTCLFELNVNKEGKSKLIDLESLNYLLVKAVQDTFASFPTFTVFSDSLIAFYPSNSIVIFSSKSKRIVKIYNLPIQNESNSLSFASKNVAFKLGANLWIIDSKGEGQQITFDSVSGITNGEVPYRTEFGEKKGINWSPLGNYLAFYRIDQSKVTDYPLVNSNTHPASLKNIRYPMVGMQSQETEIWIYSLSDKRLSKIQTLGARDSYHTNISWSPDEKYIVLQDLNRKQDFLEVNRYSITDGKKEKTLFTDSDKQYVEPQFPVWFSARVKGNFYYLSRRDGYNHLYEYTEKNGESIQLTRGLWEVLEFKGFDREEKYLYVMATKESPLEKHLYRLEREKGILQKLTSEPGSHTISFNQNFTYFIDSVSSQNIPTKLLIKDMHGAVIKELMTAENPVMNYSLGEVTISTLKAADDTTTLYYKMVKPVGFDPSKKYPVLVYVYGGSHVQLITNEWMDRTDYFLQYMAQRGFISFILDSRGSANRGEAFEDVIHRQNGIPQLDDQMKGVEFLYSLPFVDTTRIGVHGWSFGGFMTTQMMVRHPNIFKVGVAGGPVIDWKLYEVMYGERYMDTPQENPDGYQITNLTNYAGSLQGKLLLIQGAQDSTVVWQHSLLFIESCIKAGKQVDIFVYPNHEHNVKGIDREHLTQMISDYFIRNL